MHLPMLHISNRPPEWPRDEDPLHLGHVEGRDLIPWLADADKAIERAGKRTRTLDIASLIMAAVGSEITYFALLGGMFSAYNRETALAMAGVILPSVTVNQIVKARFRFPRPPRQAMHKYAFVAPGDFTFPSGHAQNAVALGLFLAQRSRDKRIQGIGIALATAVPLSRIYLGVHYPRDVLAGALLGIGSLAAVNVLERPFRDWWLRSPRGSRGFTVALTCAIAGLLTGAPLAAFPLGIGGGLALGHDLSGQYRFRIDKPKGSTRIKQGAVGVGMILGTGFAIRPLLKRESSMAAALAGGLVGVAITFGVPITTNILKRINYLRKHRKALKTKQKKRVRRRLV